jgi:chemotaxis signal transduction protein
MQHDHDSEDPLSLFRSEADDESGPSAADDELLHVRALLIFDFDGVLMGVPASSVDAVIGWRTPSRLPCATPGIAGVVQDRGRIVTVFEGPLGTAKSQSSSTPHRLIVCRTVQGFVGIPAETTRAVGTVYLAIEPISGEPVDSSEGPITVVDPEHLVEQCLGNAESTRVSS